MEEQERHQLALVGGNGHEQILIVLAEDNDVCRLVCEYRGKSIQADKDNYFDALCSIRRMLEAESLIPMCYGASLNVYPSPMAYDMGNTQKAYKLTLGKSARSSDLVDIFATGLDITPASVDEQARFYDQWIGSLR